MQRVQKSLSIVIVTLLLLGGAVSSTFAQAGSVAVMTLKDGTTVSMTSAQLAALAAQPGIAISTAAPASPGTTQMAVPISASLGGGFIVGDPGAIATGLNTIGVTTTTTAGSVAGATAATGTIAAGAAAAGSATAAGVGAGTIALGGAAAAALAAALATGGGGGGTSTSHHATTVH